MPDMNVRKWICDSILDVPKCPIFIWAAFAQSAQWLAASWSVNVLFLVSTRTINALLATFFHYGFLLCLFFDPEDGGDMFLRNAGLLSTDYTALCPNSWLNWLNGLDCQDLILSLWGCWGIYSITTFGSALRTSDGLTIENRRGSFLLVKVTEHEAGCRNYVHLGLSSRLHGASYWGLLYIFAAWFLDP
jgi:hypothetical protein